MKRLNKSELKKNIEARINSDIEACNISGAVCLVMQDGEVLYKGAFGVKTPGTDIPLSEDAVFRLASMTKPITAAAAMILVDRGLLSVTDRVSRYIPEFANMRIAELSDDGRLVGTHPAKNELLIKQLLSHSSGIGTGNANMLPEGGQTAHRRKTLGEAAIAYSESLLAFEPETKAEYSPCGAFDVLARIIEIVSGEEYEEFLKKEIFKPCKMIDTTFEPSPEQWERMITMHNKIDGKSVVGKTWEGCVFTDIPTSHKLGGAGLVSTLADYKNFAEMLANGGEIFGKRILSEAAIREMSKRQLSKAVNPCGDIWGLGVRVICEESGSVLPLGSFGWSGAFGTHFWVDRENKVVGIYMKNSGYDGGSGAVTAANFEKDVVAAFE